MRVPFFRSPIGLVLSVLTLFSAITAQAEEGRRGAVLIDDPLTDGKASATRVVGGEFTADGWRSTDHTDRLYYVLPEDVRAGRITFEVRGIELGQGPPRQHIWGVYDVFADRNDPKDYSSGCNGLTLRIYHQDKESHKPGETRFRADGARFTKKRQADSAPLEWDPQHWYRIEITWTPHDAEWRRDGELMGRIALPDSGVVLRHLYVNNDRHHVFDGLQGPTYRNLVIHDLTGTSPHR